MTCACDPPNFACSTSTLANGTRGERGMLGEMALPQEQDRMLALMREGLSAAAIPERMGLPRPVV